MLKPLLQQTLLGLLIVNLAFPPQTYAASWFSALFESAQQCTSRMWHRTRLITETDEAFIHATKQFRETAEVYNQIQLHKDVVISHAKKICGGEFCDMKQATEVLRKTVYGFLPQIQAIRVNQQYPKSQVMTDFFETAGPWVMLAGLGMFTGAIAKGAGELAEIGGAALLLNAIASIVQHRQTWKTQQQLQAYFDSLPDNSVYWEKLKTANGGPTKTKASGVSASRVRIDVLTRFAGVQPDKFVEFLNQSPEAFFRDLANQPDDTVAYWIVELVEFSAKSGANDLAIPAEITPMLKFNLLQLPKARKDHILQRFYEMYVELYPTSNAPSKYEKTLNEQLFN